MRAISRVSPAFLLALILFLSACGATNQDPLQADNATLIQRSLERLITDHGLNPTSIAIQPGRALAIDVGMVERIAADLSASWESLVDLRTCDQEGICNLGGFAAHFGVDGFVVDGNTATVTITVTTPPPLGVRAPPGLGAEGYEVEAEAAAEGWRVGGPRVVAAN